MADDLAGARVDIDPDDLPAANEPQPVKRRRRIELGTEIVEAAHAGDDPRLDGSKRHDPALLERPESGVLLAAGPAPFRWRRGGGQAKGGGGKKKITHYHVHHAGGIRVRL